MQNEKFIHPRSQGLGGRGREKALGTRMKFIKQKFKCSATKHDR